MAAQHLMNMACVLDKENFTQTLKNHDIVQSVILDIFFSLQKEALTLPF